MACYDEEQSATQSTAARPLMGRVVVLLLPSGFEKLVAR